MFKFYIFLFVLGLSLYCGDCAENELSSSGDLSWDILVFVQNWPETVCKDYMSENASHICRYPDEKNAWSVHGIWPTKTGTTGPSKCNKSAEFDLAKIKSIQTELEEVWTDVHGDMPQDDFWSHEWYKHGTCALTVPALDTELKYFNQAIVWLKKYWMTDILNGANITPSNTKNYEVEDFNKAVVDKLGVKPFVSCYINCGAQYIKELRICFDKQLNLKDCAPYNSTSSAVNTDCNVTQSVVYPEITKKSTKYEFNFFFNSYFPFKIPSMFKNWNIPN